MKDHMYTIRTIELFGHTSFMLAYKNYDLLAFPTWDEANQVKQSFEAMR
jgi:hypothetical protein